MHSAQKLLIIVALLTLSIVTNVNAQLARTLPSSDADAIELRPKGGRGKGPVQICLVTAKGMKLKEIRLADNRILKSRNGTKTCTTVPSASIRYRLAKQRHNGLILEVGAGILDLSGYGGGQIIILWRKD